jgi:predicted RecA/RadA family phage recombinase
VKGSASAEPFTFWAFAPVEELSMKTFVKPADTITVTASRTASSGALMKVGQIVGVLVGNAVNATPCELQVEGEVTVAKTSALALAQGDVVYLDNTNFVVNATSAAQQEVGYVTVAAANPSATVTIRLVPTLRTSVAA